MKSRTMVGAVVLLSLALVAFVLVQMTQVGDGGSVGVKEAGATCTDIAPDCLPKVDMVDIQGQVFSPDQLAGNVVVINFWATWCKPCLREIPALSRVHGKYKDRGVFILGIMNDQVDQERLESFQKQTGMSFPVIRVDDDLLDAYQYPSALPTTFIYGRDGGLHLKKRGELEEAELSAAIDTLLSASENPE